MNYKRLFIPNSQIFITLVTENRHSFLTENFELLKLSIKNVQNFYNFRIVAYVVMPDHIHTILEIEKAEDYPKIIKSFKYSFTKQLKEQRSDIGKVWQNRYWEHNIRDDEDFEKHMNYIHYNPVKHKLSLNVVDWEFSSFDEFVSIGFYEKNWGNYSDVKEIECLNFE